MGPYFDLFLNIFSILLLINETDKVSKILLLLSALLAVFNAARILTGSG